MPLKCFTNIKEVGKICTICLKKEKKVITSVIN